MIAEAVEPMMAACGNSYANAWLEKWLRWAKSRGAYEGRVIGNICDLKDAWEIEYERRFST